RTKLAERFVAMSCWTEKRCCEEVNSAASSEKYGIASGLDWWSVSSEAPLAPAQADRVVAASAPPAPASRLRRANGPGSPGEGESSVSLARCMRSRGNDATIDT